MDASSPPAPPRRRFSLLLGPWHTSSRVVAVLVLLFLVFCNVPGQVSEQLGFGNLPPLVADIWTETRLEHGWPLTYLSRSHGAPVYAPEVATVDCFELWKDVEEFRLVALLANIVIVLVLTGAIGAGFEAWRQTHQRFQVHLRDLLALLLMVSGLGAWFLNQRQQYAEQQRILHPAPPDDPQPVLNCTCEEGGITWLRLLAGDWAFAYLDRPLSVTVLGRDGWPQVVRLPATRELDFFADASTADLRHVAQLPNLEALWLGELDPIGSHGNQKVELPPLPKLRGLKLELTKLYRGIDRAPSLEVLSIAQSKVDDRTFQEIKSLSKLRELSLQGLEVTADRLTTLSSLPNLRALEVSQTSFDDDVPRRLKHFHSLTYLALRNCRLAGVDLRVLSALSNLETLDLGGTQVVTNSDVAALADLRRLRQLYLTDTLVNREAIPHLLKLRQLRLLVLPRRGFSEADEELLRQQLPQCEIHLER